MTALEFTSEKEASAEMLEAAAGRVGKAKRFYADFELGDFVDAPDGALTYFHEVERRDAHIAELEAENERLRKALDALGAFAFWFQKYPEFKPNPDMQAEMLADLDRARPFIPARRALEAQEQGR